MGRHLVAPWLDSFLGWIQGPEMDPLALHTPSACLCFLISPNGGFNQGLSTFLDVSRAAATEILEIQPIFSFGPPMMMFHTHVWVAELAVKPGPSPAHTRGA